MVNYFSVKLREFVQETMFRRKFPDSAFLHLDKTLKQQYLEKSPYQISKEYLRNNGYEDVYQYGETPLTTMHQIGVAAEIKPTDHLFELGSATGRTSFFLHHYFRCPVTGIEQIEEFVKKGNEIAKQFSKKVEFRNENFLQTNFALATIIYLFGSCLEDKVIYELCDLIPEKTKVITVSYPLGDYDPRFKIEKKIQAKFLWGKTEVYISK